MQLFFIFFGLPSVGVKLDELTAALLAMIVNLGDTAPKSSVPASRQCPTARAAGLSLAMSRLQVFRHVALKPRCAKYGPALSSGRHRDVRLGGRIATEELTFAANFIQSRNFRAFSRPTSSPPCLICCWRWRCGG